MSRRALRRLLTALAPALAGAGAALAPAAAQDTIPPRPRPAPAPRDTVPRPPPDTVPRPPRDTTRIGIPPEAVRGDTLPDQAAGQDTVPPDSTIAAPAFPAHPLPPAHGFADAAWVFGRQELGQFHGLSVAELLDRIPGLGITRAGSFGRPLAVSPFFSGGGRMRVFLDGYELRALSGSSSDLQRIPIVNLAEVRVHRGMHEVRVDLTSFRLSDVRPYALIEGMDGDYDSRALRGMFTRPVGRRFLAEIALDLVETDGFLRREPYGSTHGIGRLSYAFSPDLGLQLEYRTSKVDAERRIGQTRLAFESFDRSELILRGRGRIGRLHLEALAGRTKLEPAGEDTVTLPVDNLQAEVRATVESRIGLLSGGVRLHRGEEDGWAPDATELWGRLDFAPGRGLAATGEVRSLTVGGVTGLETEATLRAGLGAFSVFGSLAAGTRGIRFRDDTTLVVPTIGGIVGLPGVPTLDTIPAAFFRTADPALNALRAGAEYAGSRVRLGAAFVSHDVEMLLPFGFVTDAGVGEAEGERVTGVEGYASFPIRWRQLRFEGWYQRWLSGEERRYLPTQLGRAALEFTGLYRGGALEPLIRLELLGRDQAQAPDPATGELVVTPRYALVNAYVQIRILDVRVFWRFDNLLNQRGRFELPGTELPGGRALYGVRWFFRN
jgi:TonB-dependent receptor-like protein